MPPGTRACGLGCVSTCGGTPTLGPALLGPALGPGRVESGPVTGRPLLPATARPFSWRHTRTAHQKAAVQAMATTSRMRMQPKASPSWRKLSLSCATRVGTSTDIPSADATSPMALSSCRDSHQAAVSCRSKHSHVPAAVTPASATRRTRYVAMTALFFFATPTWPRLPMTANSAPRAMV